MHIYIHIYVDIHLHYSPFRRFFKNLFFFGVLRGFHPVGQRWTDSLKLMHLEFLGPETEGKGCPKAGIFGTWGGGSVSPSVAARPCGKYIVI